MSFFGDFPFFLCLIPALIPAVVLGIKQKSIKYYSLFLSVLFIYLIFHRSVSQLLFLIAFYFIELHLVKIYLILRQKYGRNGTIYGHAVAFAILPLVLSKFSGILGNGIFAFLGISYLTFKVVQIIIETYDGVIKEVSVFSFTSFLLFFPAISSGPIDRSRRFHEDLNHVWTRREYLDLLGKGLMKIMLGLAYKFVFAGLFYQVMGYFGKSTAGTALLGYMYGYGFYLFFDFAGYSLMAVGVSYILGIRTPDNFRFPFISKDIKEFWDRWHITLSHWFRDFIFSRFMMKAIKKKWFKTRLNGASAAFIVNMLVMGVWHGLSGYYVLYGLYHGVLLACTEIYQKKSKFYAAHKEKKWYQVLSWFVTFQLVMFGFLIFSGRFTEVVGIWIQTAVTGI